MIFWRPFEPIADFDITRLRPADLRRGKRFETEKDAARNRETTIRQLSHQKFGSHLLAETLRDCRDGGDPCERPYCHVCMRQFRIWRCAEFFRICLAAKGPIYFLTLTGDRVPFDKIDGKKHRVKRYRQRLYQQIRNEMPRAIALGGWEASRKRGTEKVRIHVHLILLNVTEAQIEAFCDRYYGGPRDHKLIRARKLPRLVSYVQKFTTYHRPHKQKGGRKPPAVPLPPRLHTPLVKWMAAHHPWDFLFLFNLRREGMAPSRSFMVVPPAASSPTNSRNRRAPITARQSSSSSMPSPRTWRETRRA